MKKRIIITWVSEWLGYELAKLYLESWYEVIWLSRTKSDLDIVHLKTDLTKEEEISNTVKVIKEDYKEFEFVVNCAWVMSVEELNDIKYKSLEDVFKLNVLAPMFLVSSLTDLIRKNESDIVNVASTVAFKSYESQATYCSSKWALRGFTQNLQLEFKWQKSRVIWFNPGGFKSRILQKVTWVKTDLSPYMEPREIAKLLKQILDLPKNMEVSEIVLNRKSL